jgi:UDP-glucose 4-epimerase
VDPSGDVKILVTGATGFVASHLVPALAAGREVVALGHDESRIPTGDGIEPLVVDLRDAAGALLPKVDAIVHLAQANAPFPEGALDIHAVNTAATVTLLDHARRCGTSRFVFASSASVYGFGDQRWTEEDIPAASDFYSATKLAAEGFVGAYRRVFGTTILRLVAPYGPGQRNRMIPRLIDSVRDGRPITLNVGAKPRMNPVYVDDVVRVIEAALSSEGHQIVNVAGNEIASIRELCESIGRAIDVAPLFEQGEGKAGDIVCSNECMRAEFDLDDLVSLDDGLSRTAAGAATTA